MLIDWLRIKNFRCIKDMEVVLSDLTAFVGRNGSGKSTTLHALRIFYEVKAPISEDDFFNGDTGTPIEITVAYRDLGPEELKEFGSYMDGDFFAVTKKISERDGSIDQRYYASRLQIPIIANLRGAKNKTAQRDGWNELVDNASLPEIGPKSMRGDDPAQLMDAYELEHPELRELVPQEVQFLGPPNIGGGTLDKFTKFVYIPAVRDASDDSAEKRGSPLYQLLDFMVMRRFRGRADVRLLQEEYSGKLRGLYDPSNLTEFSELADDISTTLQLYVPSARFGLKVSEPHLPEIPSPATIAELIEDDYAGSIERKGHGLQRALIFSLLQHMAVAKPIEADIPETHDNPEAEAIAQVVDNNERDTTTDPALIIAIEEPELYQHPLRARHLSRILLEMSSQSTLGPGGRNQILYTTHSPYFVDLGRFDQLRIVRKVRESHDEPPCTSASCFTLKAASEEIARLAGKPSDSYTAESFRARAHPVMTLTVNEGFFADVVVLVEGNTEAAALVAVAEIVGSDWLSKGIAVIPVEGKTKLDRPAIVFRGLGIPTYIVFDADRKHKGSKKEQQEAGMNRSLLRLGGGDEEDFPATKVSKDFACFEEDFEDYCREEIGKEAYDSLREKAADAHGFGASDGIKNFDVVYSLVSNLYQEGFKLSRIEQIVDQVNKKAAHIPIPGSELSSKHLEPPT